MQDKWSNKALADQGWQGMEALLDQEMPVASKTRKKRRWLLLLFLFLGFGAAYGGHWWWKATTTDKTLPVVSAPVATLPGTTEDTGMTMDAQAKDESITKTNRPSTEGSGMIVQEASDRSNPPTGSPPSPILNPSPANTTKVLATLPAPSSEAEGKKTVSKGISSTQPTTASGSVIIAPTIASRSFQVEANAAIPILDADLVTSKQTGLAYVGMSLEAGVVSHQLKQTDGGALRLLVDWNGKQSGFGLRTGIGYRLHTNRIQASDRRFSNSVTNLLDNAAVDVFEATSGGSITFAEFENLREAKEAQRTYLKTDVRTRHELLIPVWATYSLNPKWQFDVGPELGYLFALQEEERVEAAVMDSGVGNEFDPTRFSEADSVGPESLNPWRLRIGMGLSYRPIQNLGLRVQYQHLLTDRFSSGQPTGLDLPKGSMQFSLLLNW